MSNGECESKPSRVSTLHGAVIDFISTTELVVVVPESSAPTTCLQTLTGLRTILMSGLSEMSANLGQYLLACDYT